MANNQRGSRGEWKLARAQSSSHSFISNFNLKKKIVIVIGSCAAPRRRFFFSPLEVLTVPESCFCVLWQNKTLFSESFRLSDAGSVHVDSSREIKVRNCLKKQRDLPVDAKLKCNILSMALGADSLPSQKRNHTRELLICTLLIRLIHEDESSFGRVINYFIPRQIR
jgi:hypothetical protein